MGKKGPCFHCGIDRTPLWRNGPPEKPVLCNACGSRYRLGKPLENYTPKNNILVLRRRKQKAAPKTTAAVEKPVVTSNSSSNNVLEDHCASSESSTIISHNLNHEEENRDDEINRESCGGISLWSSQIPSRRRTQVVYSSLTTIQKLQRDLHKILRHEGPFNGTEPDDVLIHNTNINKLQIPPREIGLGSILLKFPVTHQEQKNELPCSPGLLDAEIAAPPLLENACGNHDDDVEGVQNKASPIELENNGGNSPTKGAADS